MLTGTRSVDSGSDRSGSLDLDQTIRTPSGVILIWIVRSRSDVLDPIRNHSYLDRPFTIGRPGAVVLAGGGAELPETRLRQRVAVNSSE